MFSGGGGNSRQPALAAAAVVTPTSLRKSRRFRPSEIGASFMPSSIPRLLVAGPAIEIGRVRHVLAIRLVTRDTEAHVQLDHLVHDRHLLHRTVAGLAAHAGQHVAL